MFDVRAVVRIKTAMRKFNPNHDELGQFSEGSNATNSDDLKIVEIRGNETFKPKDGSTTRRATLIVLDDEGKEFKVDVRASGVEGAQFVEVEAKRGNKQIGYLWAQTDYDNEYGRKGKVAIGQVDVIKTERRKGIATALMKLGKRYNIGEEPIYHSTILTTAGAAFARNTKIEKTHIKEEIPKVFF